MKFDHLSVLISSFVVTLSICFADFDIVPDPDKFIENGQLGPVRIFVPKKHRERAVQMKYIDKMIISDELTRQKFFRSKTPCNCENCVENRTCGCKKFSKLRIKNGKLCTYDQKLSPWDHPIVPCDASCACKAECGTKPVPISSTRMYIAYNEKMQFGLYAADQIDRGEMIGEYLGEVFIDEEKIPSTEYTFMVPLYDDNDDSDDDKTDYALIDSSRFGNHSSMANHNCSPSAEAIYFYVPNSDGTKMHPTIGLFAKKELQAGEEITIHYGMDYWKDKSFQCECGSRLCFERKKITDDNRWKDKLANGSETSTQKQKQKLLTDLLMKTKRITTNSNSGGMNIRKSSEGSSSNSDNNNNKLYKFRQK
uniref:SET domain-containing protein n=1 Tax=Globodera rostochiensis TaxID=31243 RepID=A0A914HTY9_GLORO